SACSAAATPVPTAAPTAKPATPAPTKEPDGTLPTPELAKLRLGTGIGEISQFNAVLADQLGFYKKYGVDVTVTRFNSGGDALGALLAGQLEILSNGGADMPIKTQVAGQPIVMLSSFKSRIFDGIFCRKEIKTPAEMKGKTVAISTLGGSPHASLLVALPAMGLTGSDIVVLQVGSNSVRLAALKAGSVDCVPASIEDKATLLGLGFNLLIDLSTSKTSRYPAPALLATPDFIKKNPNTVLALLAAQLEAQHVMITNTPLTGKEWAKFAQVSEAEGLTRAAAVIAQLDHCMMWEDDWMKFPREVFAITAPHVANADLKALGDHTIQQKLVDLGFYKKVGAPVTC
ncbi:MAG: ABC transporter substrate-binding protein, partial [Myxococcales bacterium]|nr:ABC transporter substrate-binding protein [Myxococcales bacterium]